MFEHSKALCLVVKKRPFGELPFLKLLLLRRYELFDQVAEISVTCFVEGDAKRESSTYLLPFGQRGLPAAAEEVRLPPVLLLPPSDVAWRKRKLGVGLGGFAASAQQLTCHVVWAFGSSERCG